MQKKLIAGQVAILLVGLFFLQSLVPVETPTGSFNANSFNSNAGPRIYTTHVMVNILDGVYDMDSYVQGLKDAGYNVIWAHLDGYSSLDGNQRNYNIRLGQLMDSAQNKGLKVIPGPSWWVNTDDQVLIWKDTWDHPAMLKVDGKPVYTSWDYRGGKFQSEVMPKLRAAGYSDNDYYLWVNINYPYYWSCCGGWQGDGANYKRSSNVQSKESIEYAYSVMPEIDGVINFAVNMGWPKPWSQEALRDSLINNNKYIIEGSYAKNKLAGVGTSSYYASASYHDFGFNYSVDIWDAILESPQKPHMVSDTTANDITELSYTTTLAHTQEDGLIYYPPNYAWADHKVRRPLLDHSGIQKFLQPWSNAYLAGKSQPEFKSDKIFIWYMLHPANADTVCDLPPEMQNDLGMQNNQYADFSKWHNCQKPGWFSAVYDGTPGQKNLDDIRVGVHLTQPARIQINDKVSQVFPAGPAYYRIPMGSFRGEPYVAIIRDDKTVLSGKGPQPITNSAWPGAWNFLAVEIASAPGGDVFIPPTPSIPTEQSATPYGGTPWNVPGVVEAENYDVGGFSDTTSNNEGGSYRTDAVDLEPSSVNGHNIGWIRSGEWVEYTINAQAGIYDVNFQVASAVDGTKTFHIERDGQDISGPISFSTNNGWQSYVTTSAFDIELNSGIQTLRIVFDSDFMNLNQMSFTLTQQACIEEWSCSQWSSCQNGKQTRTCSDSNVCGSTSSKPITSQSCTITTGPYKGTPWAVPGTIQIEDFDLDNWYDTSSGNNGGGYRDTDVDLSSAGAMNGYKWGWTQPGEYLSYTINVQTAGFYEVDLRVSNQLSDSHIVRIQKNGADISGPINIKPTGSWTNYITVSREIELEKGIQTLKLIVEEGTPDVDEMIFSLIEIPPCEESWVCEDWSSCSENGQTRECSDANSCGSTDFKPVLTQSCQFAPSGEVVVEKEAEDYTKYYDTSIGNSGGAYKSDDVDIGSHDGGYNIGWIEPGEWLEYEVSISESGTYVIDSYVASQPSGIRKLHYGIEGQNIPVSYSSTGDWNNYIVVPSSEFSLSAGDYTLRVTFETGDQGFDKFALRKIADASVSETGKQIPGIIQAEDYDRYYDTSIGNSGGAYKSDDVDVEVASINEYNIGWIQKTEFVEYDVSVMQPGSYDIILQVAGYRSVKKAMTIQIDGKTVSANSPSTGGWQKWTTVVIEDVQISSGNKKLKIIMEDSGFNLNQIEFKKI